MMVQLAHYIHLWTVEFASITCKAKIYENFWLLAVWVVHRIL